MTVAYDHTKCARPRVAARVMPLNKTACVWQSACAASILVGSLVGRSQKLLL